MASWSEFAQAEPEMAKVLTSLLDWIPITYLATVCRDGAPRVHPICPIIGEGRMFVAVNENSPKRHDLRRDRRYAMHALPGKRDGEFLLIGRAVASDDWGTRMQAAIEAKKINMTSKNDVAFELTIDRAHWAIWEGLGTLDIRRKARMWHAT